MWLIKAEEEIDERYGKRPDDRTVEEIIKASVIVVDKHSGPSSQQIDKWVKDIFHIKKTGHAGTLV